MTIVFNFKQQNKPDRLWLILVKKKKEFSREHYRIIFGKQVREAARIKCKINPSGGHTAAVATEPCNHSRPYQPRQSWTLGISTDTTVILFLGKPEWLLNCLCFITLISDSRFCLSVSGSDWWSLCHMHSLQWQAKLGKACFLTVSSSSISGNFPNHRLGV